MSDEARINSSLILNSGELSYRSFPTAFLVDVTTPNGPTPGKITATLGGTDVDLSELSSPGLCRIANIDDTNYVTFGIWDGATFHPLGEVGPGRSYVLELSRSIGLGVGTGYENLRIVADTASCFVIVDAFNR